MSSKIAAAVSVVFLLLAPLACAHRALTNEAEELAEAGQHLPASKKCLAALEKKPGYAPAVIQLGKSAPLVQTEWLAAAERHGKDGTYDAGLAILAKAKKFHAAVGAAGVSLPAVDFNKLEEQIELAGAMDHYDRAELLYAKEELKAAIREYRIVEGFQKGFRETSVRLADSHYRLGLKNEEWDYLHQAVEHYEKSNAAVRDYQGVQLRLADVNYRLGTQAMDGGKYRTAVKQFEAVRRWSRGYEDSEQLLADANKKAIVRVALLRFTNRTGQQVGGLALEELISDDVLRRLGRDKSRFVLLIDRANIDHLLDEQDLAVSSYSGGSGAPAGQLSGVDYLIAGKITRLIGTPAHFSRTTRTQTYRVPTYKKVLKTRKDGSQVWKEEKAGQGTATARYTEVTGSTQFTVTGNVTILDARTGQIRRTLPFEVSSSDSVRYAENLTQKAPPASKDQEVSNYYPREISKLENARKSLTSLRTFADAAVGTIGKKLSSSILSAVDREDRF